MWDNRVCDVARNAARRDCCAADGIDCRAGGASAGRGTGLRRRGDGGLSEAADRQDEAREVRAIGGARPQAARPAGTPARGAGSECHGRRSRGWVGRAGSHLGTQLGRQAADASAVTSSPAARARGRAGTALLSVLWRQARQTRRGRHRDLGSCAAPVEGDPDGAREVQLPGMREDHPTTGTVPRHPPAPGLGRACWR